MLSPTFEALLSKGSYPHPVSHISLIETPTSWVFVTDTYTYKIKRPVATHVLDFSTLEQRHYFCQREIVLNRRFSEGIYLGVVPIVRQGNRMQITGEGTVEEYAVQMKTLPRDREMKTLLQKGLVPSTDVSMVGKRIAEFHLRAEVISVEVYSYLKGIEFLVNEPGLFHKQLQETFGLGDQLEHVLAQTKKKFVSLQEHLLQRQKAGLIRDCHGDFHAGNIIVDKEPIFFDCIEYRDEFRYLDPLHDLAFLATELEKEGRFELSKELLHSYARVFSEMDMPLLAFYQLLRANLFFVLTMVALPKVISPEEYTQTQAKIQHLFMLAESYLSLTGY